MARNVVRYAAGLVSTLVIVLGLPGTAYAAPLEACIGDAVAVTEGAVNATFRIDTCGENTPGSMTVTYTTANGTAAAPGDYTAKGPTTVTISKSSPATVNVAVSGDMLDEDNEIFLVNLSNPSGGVIRQGTGVGTINDNDNPPTISVGDVSINEATGVTSGGNFTATLSAASGKPITVNYATANGTAVEPGDYASASGQLSFNPGETTKQIPIVVQGDPSDEVNETFTIALSTPSNVTIADGTGAGTIVDDDGPPALSINDVSVTEGDAGTTDVVYTVTLSPASGKAVSVQYATADGSASAPADYTGATGTLNYPAGQTTRTVTVLAKGDVLDEADETLNLDLASPSNASLTDARGVATITDNDPTPSLSVADVTVTEGNAGTQNAAFTVTLSAASGRTVTVDYATADGSAIEPDDYSDTSGMLTFTPGQTEKTVNVPVVGEFATELAETYTLNLSSASNASIADAVGIGTITDTDPDPTVSVDDVTVNEGNAGTTNAAFTVELSASSYKAVSVDYATSDVTATAPSDYTAKSGTINFAPGETSKTVLVAVAGDLPDEADETFDLVLSTPVNTSIVGGNGVATITDDDTPPSLSIDNVTIAEGDGGTTQAVFTVSLSAASGRTVSVDYVTVAGDAVAPADFTATSDTLTFSAGDTEETVTVDVEGDLLDEPDEAYTVQLSNASHATIADAQGTGTITDDDVRPTIDVSDAAITEGDAGTDDATFTVTLSAPSGRNVKVDYATADGTAVEPDDYEATSGQFSFAPGETSKTVDVPVVGEMAAELNETFVLDLSAAVHGDIGTAQGVATITDNDPDPTLSIDNVSVDEGNAGTTAATFTVSLSAISFKTVMVDYASADGTAVAPDDYGLTAETLTFSPGETTKQVVVDVAGDSFSEGNEAFTVELSNADNATIADASGTATISDDDAEPTSLTVTAKKAGRKLIASGTLVNAEVGMTVTIKLQKKKGSKYVRGVSRTAMIRTVTDANSDGTFEGRYTKKFKRPAKGAYRFLVTFVGDATHLPSTAIKKFRV